jgi:ISXO2-like transposase domain
LTSFFGNQQPIRRSEHFDVAVRVGKQSDSTLFGGILAARSVSSFGQPEGRAGVPEAVSAAPALHRFIDTNVAASATARTDGWSAYPGMPAENHEPHIIGPMAAPLVLPWVHRVFANLKTWALGVYRDLRDKGLQSYLDEFVFRFNRRRTRQAAFHSLLGIGMRATPHLQDVDLTGSSGISLYRNSFIGIRYSVRQRSFFLKQMFKIYVVDRSNRG